MILSRTDDLAPTHAGATMFAYFMGNMANIISAHDSSTAQMARKKVEVDDFLKHRGVPKWVMRRGDDRG